MTKAEFCLELREKLSGFPNDTVENSIEYYSEMIDDRIEDGLSEEDAVAGIGTADKIVSDILESTPLPALIKEKVKPKRALNIGMIILIVLGSPLWISILAAIFAVLLSLYIIIWSVVICLYATVLSLVAFTVGSIVSFVLSTINENMLSGVFLLGLGLVSGGLAILMFFVSNMTARLAVLLGKKILLWVKYNILVKERYNETV